MSKWDDIVRTSSIFHRNVTLALLAASRTILQCTLTYCNINFNRSFGRITNHLHLLVGTPFPRDFAGWLIVTSLKKVIKRISWRKKKTINGGQNPSQRTRACILYGYNNNIYDEGFMINSKNAFCASAYLYINTHETETERERGTPHNRKDYKIVSSFAGERRRAVGDLKSRR